MFSKEELRDMTLSRAIWKERAETLGADLVPLRNEMLDACQAILDENPSADNQVVKLLHDARSVADYLVVPSQFGQPAKGLQNLRTKKPHILRLEEGLKWDAAEAQGFRRPSQLIDAAEDLMVQFMALHGVDKNEGVWR